MIEEIASQSEDTDDSVTSTTHFATRPTDEEMSHLFETLSLTGTKLQCNFVSYCTLFR